MSEDQDHRFASSAGDSRSPALPGRGSAAKTAHGEITLHQLRIFWTIAHSDTLTKAAKQLGLAQPSLSQQLSKLETTAGARLFDRRSNQMSLTEAGHFLMPKAELVLRNMGELEDCLSEFVGGARATIRLSGVNSILRVILPLAMQKVLARFPDVDFDIHENAPADVLELLNSRRVNIGLVAANSLPPGNAGLLQIPVVDDPYVLVVPKHIDLARVKQPKRDLDHAAQAILNQSIHFIFGTQHSRRIEDWYDRMLPEHHITAQCRSFEVAIGLVRGGLGVCLAPALSAVAGAAALDGVHLYRVQTPTRKIVALVPSQYRRIEPYAALLDALQEVGAGFAMPMILPTPPFLKNGIASEL